MERDARAGLSQLKLLETVLGAEADWEAHRHSTHG
jgi:hypothetical protein